MLSPRLPRLLTFFLLSALSSITPAIAHAKLSDTEMDAMKLLVLGPKNNDFRQCLDSAFGLLGGLLAVAHAPDEKVAELLTKGEMNVAQRQRREQQASMWKEHHSPAKLAHADFESCLTEKRFPPVDLGAQGTQCFNVAMVPAYALQLKAGLKASKEEALEKVGNTWRAQTTPKFLQQVINEIYSADNDEAVRAVSRRVFIGCMSASQRN
mgnify:FL=1